MEKGMSLMGFSSKAKASRLRGKVHETSPSVAKEAKVSTKVSTTTGGDSITAVLNDLKSRDDAVRKKAGQDLRTHVLQQSRDVSRKNFLKFGKELSNRVVKLVNSNTSEDKVAAIMIIDCLIEVDFDENPSVKITRLSNYLHQLQGGSDFQVLQMASNSLGKLVRCEGSLTAEIVDGEVRAALDTLRDSRQNDRWLGAVLILQEMAVNAPPLFYVQVASFFDLIWNPLQDTNCQLRESATQALRAALVLVSERKSKQRAQWYDKLWQHCLLGLRNSSVDSTHGSLMAIGELINNAGEFMANRVKEICETLNRFKDFKNDKGSIVRKTVCSLLPVTARFAPQEFARDYLDNFIQFLFDVLRNSKEIAEHAAAFRSIGEVFTACAKHRSRLAPFFTTALSLVKTCLQSRKLFCEEALTCVANVAKAMKGDIDRKVLNDILPLMLQSGLSMELRQALSILVEEVPELLEPCQSGLVEVCSYAITKKPFPWPPAYSQQNTKTGSTNPSALQSKIGATENETIFLAMKTLEAFNFEQGLLVEFARDVLVDFLDDDDPQMRLQAALTCAKQALNVDKRHAAEMSSSISEVIEKLLIVGIADPEPSIRRSVLASFDERFDNYLAMAENLRSLFIALNDEIFEVRELAIAIIGRLTIRNPAFVMPSLRKMLVQLLTELEFSGDPTDKEESARLLGHLISSSKMLTKPYVVGIREALLPKLEDENPRVASAVLGAIGTLAQVAGVGMKAYLGKLMPFIVESLQDQSSVHKREVAVRALGQLCGSTGYVIKPLEDYPNLLDILINMVKQERSPTLRTDLIRTLGILGALDPYRHKVTQLRQSSGRMEEEHQEQDVATVLAVLHVSPSDEAYCAAFAVMALVRILSDPSLNKHHRQVMETLISILGQLDKNEISSLIPHFMPTFFKVLNNSDHSFREFLFQQLLQLVEICRDELREFLPRVFDVIRQYWHSNMFTIIRLLEEISRKIPEDLKVHLPGLIPEILSLLHAGDSSGDDWEPTLKVLHCLEVLGRNLDDYRHLVIPSIMRLVEQVYVPVNVRQAAILTIGRLSFQLDVADYASRISHPLARVLEGNNERLIGATMDTLCALLYQLRADYAIVIPLINKVLAKQRITHAAYEDLLSRLLKDLPMDEPVLRSPSTAINGPHPGVVSARASGNYRNEIKRDLRVNEQNLQKAWVTSQRATKDDWMEWMRKFSIELLRETPSHSLRCCFSLAQMYRPLSTELFNTAFLSCWNAMQEQYRDQLVQSLKQALLSDEIPAEITQIILNLAEFMERDGKSINIESETLGMIAEKCHAYAKALHYKEIKFRKLPSKENAEELISIYTQLQQPQAAAGVVTYAQDHHNMQLEETWSGYEKLQRWDKALAAYNMIEKQKGPAVELSIAKMRCLTALANWPQLAIEIENVWKQTDDKDKSKIAPMGAAATWHLSRSSEMDKFVEWIPPQSYEGSFYQAISALNKDFLVTAMGCIDRARQALDGELTALLAESYNRAYEELVHVQQLSEMEEIIQYKQAAKDNPERRAAILKSWTKRLDGCEKNIDLWREMLSVRGLVVEPHEIPRIWLRYADLCRKAGRLADARDVIQKLNTPSKKDKSLKPNPWVRYDAFKQKWAEGKKADAFKGLEKFSKQKIEPALLARCHLKLGEWMIDLKGMDSKSISSILNQFRLATENDEMSYKAWHRWALANFDAVSAAEKADGTVAPSKIKEHIVPAVHGFFRSIALSNEGESLQDTLRLLTLWFRHGDKTAVEDALTKGFATTSIDTWLQVIPQIIARINAPSAATRHLIEELLTSVAREHPQALVYPLTVAAQSQATGIHPAKVILEDMRTRSPQLVDQAQLVSQELIRVSVIWHEMWHEALEDACRMYFTDGNPDGMIERLAVNQEMLEKGPKTITELQFAQAFGRDLTEAYQWCLKYKKSKNPVHLNHAWDLYYHIFRKLTKMKEQMKEFDLEYVSPYLMEARDLELAVPGTYKAGEPVICIKSFKRKLNVMSSKQRPRRTHMIGSDGKTHSFLLKGHEDLRQDERVMQLFGLVNTLLAANSDTSRSHLTISRYSVIPLSPYSGLLGWVPNCDTLHGLIQNYRKMKNIEMVLEKKRLHERSTHYDTHTLIQKVEMFQHAIDATEGDDINHMLWLKSHNSEVWLERRLSYIRSMGVMSMVGYILGLGDRHPSNLMMDRVKGKIIHIDFGDCFEVAMHRDKFPEKVPFRLTRMLINAMEAGGIEGNFRSTCENVMRVLRENKESLMAVLEAFVHDPLINWRLLNTENQPSHNDEDTPDPPTKVNRSTSISELPEDDNDAPLTDISELGALVSAKAMAPEEADTTSKMPEVLNARAVSVITRVEAKLVGTDFRPEETLQVKEQVANLINQASSPENLCQSYQGWCPMW